MVEMVLPPLPKGKRNTTGGYYVYHAVVDYFKAGNTITDEQLNGMRVKDIK